MPESEVGSDVEVDVESEADVAPAAVIRPSAHIQAGFVRLDMVNVREVIAIRGCVMKVPPAFLRGAYRSMRLALQEIVSGMELKPVADSERLEVVPLAPDNVVVSSGTRRQSSEKSVAGQVEQVCGWICWARANKRQRVQQVCDPEGDGPGWTQWTRGFKGLRHGSAWRRSRPPAKHWKGLRSHRREQTTSSAS